MNPLYHEVKKRLEAKRQDITRIVMAGMSQHEYEAALARIQGIDIAENEFKIVLQRMEQDDEI